MEKAVNSLQKISPKYINPSDLRIIPLCTVSIDDTNQQTHRKSLMSNLRSTENDLILNLNTLYPYGLNDRLEKPLYVDTEKEIPNNVCVYKLFPKITHTRKHRSPKNAHHNTISHDIDLDMYYDNILQYYL